MIMNWPIWWLTDSIKAPVNLDNASLIVSSSGNLIADLLEI